MSQKPNLPELNLKNMKRTQLLKTISSARNPPVGSPHDICNYQTLFYQKSFKELGLLKNRKATQTLDMMKDFSQKARESLYLQQTNARLTHVQNKLADSQEQETNAQLFHQEQENLFEEEIQRKWEQLLLRQDNEMEQCRNNHNPSHYRKRSPRLLNLIQQERRLLRQSRFPEADMIHKDIVQLEEQESALQENQQIKDTLTRTSLLAQRHQREQEVFQDWVNQKQKNLQMNDQKQIKAIQLRAKYLQDDANKIEHMKVNPSFSTVSRELSFGKFKSLGVPYEPNIDERLDKEYSKIPLSGRVYLKNL